MDKYALIHAPASQSPTYGPKPATVLQKHSPGLADPHFLSNSLDNFYELISSDPDKGERYLKKLLRLHRYVLKNYTHPWTTLAEELAFAESFFDLQRLRHGAAISLTIGVEASYRSFKLPPISLQLLIENALKHNHIDRDSPLSILIAVDGTRQELVITNNLQVPKRKPVSSGFGHWHLRDRYERLSTTPPRFFMDGDQYVVRLPLIA